MAEEEIPKNIYIYLIIFAILLMVFVFFLNRYLIRKNSSIFINIICIFLWFTILLMVVVFPLDLFSNFIFKNDEKNKNQMKIFSGFLYWNFYIFGFILIDQIKSFICDGNLTVKSKILSILKKTGIFMIIFIGIGFAFNLILQLFLLIFDENNFLIITIKIINTIISMPMIIAYMMFLGCAIGDIPKDLYVKYNYPLRVRKLCWTMTHVMRKYKKETEFLILSINKIKLTQDIMREKDLEKLNEEKIEIEERLNNEQNEEEKNKLKSECDSIIGLKELYNYQNEMNNILTKLEQTVNYFHLNIPLDSIDNNEEKRPLKNKKELVSINEAYYIYKTQIFRINYQKYSVYKEWAEINTYMIDNKKLVLPEKINKAGLFIENSDESEEKEEPDENKISLIKDKDKNEFQKVNLTKYKTFYYKSMPIISIILMVLCIIYDIIIIEGQFEYIFKWDFACGKFLRFLFTNLYLTTAIRLSPIYFTVFAVGYAFTNIKSDMVSCVYGNRQTEPCHALFFVGMMAKLICPLCYNFIKIMYTGIAVGGNSNTKITQYFSEQFGFLEEEDNIVILVVKLIVLGLFLADIILNFIGYYGTFAYKKNQYLSYNAKYLEKELEIDEGEEILNDMNRKYGENFEKIKEDNIIE